MEWKYLSKWKKEQRWQCISMNNVRWKDQRVILLQSLLYSVYNDVTAANLFCLFDFLLHLPCFSIVILLLLAELILFWWSRVHDGNIWKINWRPGQLEWGGEGWGCLLLGPWEELLIWLDSSVDTSPPLINTSPSLSPPPGSISVKTIRVNRNSSFSPTHRRHWVAIAGK